MRIDTDWSVFSGISAGSHRPDGVTTAIALDSAVLTMGSDDWDSSCVAAGDWTLTAAQRWLADVQAQQVLWWSQRAPSGSWCLPPQRINHELGREACHGVFDYYSGANPDALAALAGTISAGGFLLLLAPSLQDWPDFADPYREKIAELIRF